MVNPVGKHERKFSFKIFNYLGTHSFFTQARYTEDTSYSIIHFYIIIQVINL